MKRALLLCSFIGVAVAPVPVSFLEYGGGVVAQNRQGVFQDTVLTPSNVNASTFGLLSTIALDGSQIYAQPLFVQGVTVGTATHDLMIVATMNNSVWAIDANNFTGVWKTNFGPSYVGYPNYSNVSNNFYQNTAVGCVSTPTVDRVNGWVFAVCPDVSGNQTLYELSLSTGAILNSVLITGQVTGTGTSGDIVTGGKLQFQANLHEQRPGLVLASGNIYVTFASYNDQPPWHGWVMAYSETSLTQTAIWCSTPNGAGGGIWLTGDAPAVDGSGNLYFSTGNGDYNGSSNFANSVVKLNSSLVLQDWFTPANYATLQAQDLDVTSGRVMLIGDGYLLAGDKDYREYLMGTGCLGRLQGSITCTGSYHDPQLVTFPGAGAFGTYGGLFWNNTVYIPVEAGPIYAYAYSGTFLAGSSFANTSGSFASPGARLALSVNGSSNAVLWATTCATSAHLHPRAGVLRAFDPTTLAELYNSTTNVGDTMGTIAKFNVPVVQGGHVWVANGDGQLMVYGLK